MWKLVMILTIKVEREISYPSMLYGWYWRNIPIGWIWIQIFYSFLSCHKCSHLLIKSFIKTRHKITYTAGCKIEGIFIVTLLSTNPLFWTQGWLLIGKVDCRWLMMLWILLSWIFALLIKGVINGWYGLFISLWTQKRGWT